MNTAEDAAHANAGGYIVRSVNGTTALYTLPGVADATKSIGSWQANVSATGRVYAIETTTSTSTSWKIFKLAI